MATGMRDDILPEPPGRALYQPAGRTATPRAGRTSPVRPGLPPALAGGFVEGDRGGHGGVEGGDRAALRDVEEAVAAAGHRLAPPAPLGADHEGERAGEVDLVDAVPLPRPGAEHAHALLAQSVDRAQQVADLGEARPPRPAGSHPGRCAPARPRPPRPSPRRG